ncbi:MAG: helix-turn-helix transcriptional regulator [Leptospirillum sp.]
MSFSHPAKNPSTVTVASTGMSGPDALWAYFEPRQVLKLKEASEVLGMSYPHFYRRVQAGTLGLRIRKNEIGERFVLLNDLISYLFPPTEQAPSSPKTTKRKPGRPRKTVTSDSGRGGAR